MLRLAPPEELAALDRLLRPGTPSSIAVAVDAAEVHRETGDGRHTTEAFGRYCRTAMPAVLRRLLAVEVQYAALRSQVARHIAAADRGDDPSAGDLLRDCWSAGIDLDVDVDAAAAVLDAEAHAAATG
jgi:hypothetical protein